MGRDVTIEVSARVGSEAKSEAAALLAVRARCGHTRAQLSSTEALPSEKGANA